MKPCKKYLTRKKINQRKIYKFTITSSGRNYKTELFQSPQVVKILQVP